VQLDDIFTDAYLLDKPMARTRYDIEQLRTGITLSETSPPKKRLNGLRLVTERKNLFVLGKPGAGKTTFLKYVALKAAEQTIDNVPIFISLKEWADSGLELINFIQQRFDICDFPSAGSFVEELLKSSRALVLFDGLDEVNQEEGVRDKYMREMTNFIEKYDLAQYLITCRPAANDCSFSPFLYVEIADLSEVQIQTFVRNWFRDNQGERDEKTSRRFLEEFAKNENKGLRDLARTPLLLTLLCLAFNEALTFPHRRIEIYEEALDALLKKWDSSRRIRRDEVYRKLSFGHKEKMLTRIAAESFEKNQYLIPQYELERGISDFVRNIPPHEENEGTLGELILKAIEAQHGIFVEQAQKVYSFSHLTIQEFLTAKYIVENAANGTLKRLVQEHSTQDRWREVFLLATSLLADAAQFMILFRKGVDDLLRDSGKPLLDWAKRKSESYKEDAWLVREIYLSAELGLLKRSDYATREASLVFDLNFILTHNTLYSAFSTAIRGALKLGLEPLAKQLAALASPQAAIGSDASQRTVADRKTLMHQLRTLMREHCDIGHDWNLTSKEKSQLIDYLGIRKGFCVNDRCCF
jgi:predicted NACHT family NTPase